MGQQTPAWKKVLVIFGILSVVGLILVFVAGLLLKTAAEDFLVELETDLPAVAEEGVRFAATHRQSECVDEGLRRVVPCGALELRCIMRGSLFGQSCLDAANPDPDLCTEVPVASGSLGLGDWAQQECRDRGHADSTSCVGFFSQTVGAYCLQQSVGG